MDPYTFECIIKKSEMLPPFYEIFKGGKELLYANIKICLKCVFKILKSQFQDYIYILKI